MPTSIESRVCSRGKGDEETMRRQCGESGRKEGFQITRRQGDDAPRKRWVTDAGRQTICMQDEAKPNLIRGISRENQRPSSGRMMDRRSVPGERRNAERVHLCGIWGGGPPTCLGRRGIISKIRSHHHPGAGSNPHARTHCLQHGHGSHGVNSSPPWMTWRETRRPQHVWSLIPLAQWRSLMDGRDWLRQHFASGSGAING
jgi:hypothetical protein